MARVGMNRALHFSGFDWTLRAKIPHNPPLSKGGTGLCFSFIKGGDPPIPPFRKGGQGGFLPTRAEHR